MGYIAIFRLLGYMTLSLCAVTNYYIATSEKNEKNKYFFLLPYIFSSSYDQKDHILVVEHFFFYAQCP